MSNNGCIGGITDLAFIDIKKNGGINNQSTYPVIINNQKNLKINFNFYLFIKVC